ncbi:unnamed protein product, partial [Ixodes pacificus]
LVDFLTSWINDVELGWVDQFLRVVHQRRMWDEVSAFFEDGASYAMTHSVPTYAAAFPGPGPHGGAPRNVGPEDLGERGDVPIPMHCWDWRVERLPHIPVTVDWPSWAPERCSGVIPLPDIRTLSLIQAGVYVYSEPYHHAGGYLAPTLREFGAFRFSVAERLHLAGSLTHRQTACGCGQLDLAA